MFTKPSWLRSPSLHDAAAVIVMVRDSTHLQAISLLTLTMKTETLGFHKFYCWFATDIMAAMLGDKNKAISSVKFFFLLFGPPTWPPCHVVASQEWVVFLCFSNFYRYGASLHGPSGRRSSAINFWHFRLAHHYSVGVKLSLYIS